MPPNDEETIQELVTRFRVDQASAEQTITENQRVLERNREISREMKELEKDDFVASLDMQRNAQERHFDNMEVALRSYYDNRLEIVRGNAEEERRIREELERDMEHLRQRRQAAQEEMDRAEQERGGGRGGAGGGIREFVGGFGFGGIAGIASAAGIAAALKEAADAIRESRTAAGEIVRGTAASPENIYPLAGRLRSIGHMTGRGQQEAARTMRQFMPIMGEGQAGPDEMENLTLSAIRMGAGTGMDPTVVAELMTQFRLLERTLLPDLNERFAEVVATADEANVPRQQFVEWLNQAVAQGREYNVTIDENTNMVRHFSRELYAGTVTVQQLAQIQQAGAETPEGFRAIIARGLIRGGGATGEILQRAGATSPMVASRVLRGILQGGMVTGEGEIVQPETEEQRELAANRRQTIQSEMAGWIRERAGGMAGPGANEAVINTYIRRLSEMLGIIKPGTTEATFEKLFTAFEKGDVTATKQDEAADKMQSAADKIKSAADLEAEGQRQLEEDLSAHEEIWQGIGTGFQQSVRMFDVGVSAFLGREDDVEREVQADVGQRAQDIKKGDVGVRRFITDMFAGTAWTGWANKMAEEQLKQERIKQQVELVRKLGKPVYINLNTDHKALDVETPEPATPDIESTAQLPR